MNWRLMVMALELLQVLERTDVTSQPFASSTLNARYAALSTTASDRDHLRKDGMFGTINERNRNGPSS